MYNFDDPHQPRLVMLLPAGRGTALRRDMDALVEDLRPALTAAFEADEYRRRHDAIDAEIKSRPEPLLAELGERAKRAGLALLQTPEGLGFAPARDNGTLDKEEFLKLPEAERERPHERSHVLQAELEAVLRKSPGWSASVARAFVTWIASSCDRRLATSWPNSEGSTRACPRSPRTARRSRWWSRTIRPTKICSAGSTSCREWGLVIELGAFAFGQPGRITARARMGQGKLVDIEREVELGGPVHSKGVLILAAFLSGRYALDTLLSLNASVVFEQSYSGIEGDSASAAELCALLSAIAAVPLTQGIAVTGSLNQHGQIQAVGGITEKVEAFFDTCRSRELTGTQGVLIPRANVQHLMLRPDVVTAVTDGRFHVYTMETIDDAIEVLTGMPAGERAESGEFSLGSFNQLVELRRQEFASRRREFDSPRADETASHGETASATPAGVTAAHTVRIIPS